MYVVDYDILLSQILPPSWRNTWRENLLRTCCEPVKGIYNELYAYIGQIPEEINLNSQVLVMETYLNRIAGYTEIRQISISDGDKNGHFIVNIPIDSTAKHLVIAYCEQFKLGGKSYTLNEY